MKITENSFEVVSGLQKTTVSVSSFKVIGLERSLHDDFQVNLVRTIQTRSDRKNTGVHSEHYKIFYRDQANDEGGLALELGPDNSYLWDKYVDENHVDTETGEVLHHHDYINYEVGDVIPVILVTVEKSAKTRSRGGSSEEILFVKPGAPGGEDVDFMMEGRSSNARYKKLNTYNRLNSEPIVDLIKQEYELLEDYVDEHSNVRGYTLSEGLELALSELNQVEDDEPSTEETKEEGSSAKPSRRGRKPAATAEPETKKVTRRKR